MFSLILVSVRNIREAVGLAVGPLGWYLPEGRIRNYPYRKVLGLARKPLLVSSSWGWWVTNYYITRWAVRNPMTYLDDWLVGAPHSPSIF